MPICPCNHCSAHIEFEDAYLGQTVACPSCGMDTMLFAPREQLEQAPSGIKLVLKHAGQALPVDEVMGSGTHAGPMQKTAWAHLKDVRKTTCYKALRVVLTYVFGFWALTSTFAVVMAVVTIPVDGAQSAMIGTATGLLSLALCIAIWQASLLLIDIADLLIRISSNKR